MLLEMPRSRASSCGSAGVVTAASVAAGVVVSGSDIEFLRSCASQSNTGVPRKEEARRKRETAKFSENAKDVRNEKGSTDYPISFRFALSLTFAFSRFLRANT